MSPLTTNNMADRKSKQDEPLKPEKSESALDFLERTGVTRQMQEAVSLALENRPEDPIAFITDYFANLAENTPSVNQAYQYLCLSHYSKPAFESNLLKAYSILSRQKCGHGLRGLIGKTLNELLTMLCRDISSNESDSLLKLLYAKDQELVRFNRFTSGVTCCFLFGDYLKQATSLYQELDLSGRGLADRTLCSAMLSQLSGAVSQTRGSSLSIFEAGTSLTSQSVDIAMKKALADSFTNNTGEIMGVEEFVCQASNIFFTKIPAARVGRK